MRARTLSGVGALLFCAALNLSAQVYFRDVTIKPRWSVDPGFSAPNAIEHSSGKAMYWLEINVDYKTVPTKGGWMDNVVFKYDILLPAQKGAPPVVLTGQVAYWSIPMDGNVHHAQAFVHPRFLQRYASQLRFKPRELKDLRIRLTILFNDSPVGMGVSKPTTRTDPRTIVAEVAKALANMKTRKVKDSIFSRNETPWAILNLDYYELIKRKK